VQPRALDHTLIALLRFFYGPSRRNCALLARGAPQQIRHGRFPIRCFDLYSDLLGASGGPWNGQDHVVSAIRRGSFCAYAKQNVPYGGSVLKALNDQHHAISPLLIAIKHVAEAHVVDGFYD
jgi:hypothetical protein